MLKVDNVTNMFSNKGAGVGDDAMEGGPVKLPVPSARLFKWNLAMAIFHLTMAIITLSVGKIGRSSGTGA